MLEFKLTDEGIEDAIKKLPQRLIRTGAFESLVIALQPTVRAMKEDAPVDEGALRQSIGFRFRRYRGGKTLYGAVGPRRGVFGNDGDQPSRRAHLIEKGHYVRTKKGHRWVAPNPFMARAWLRTRDQVLKLFRQQFGNRLYAEVEYRRHTSRKGVPKML